VQGCSLISKEKKKPEASGGRGAGESSDNYNNLFYPSSIRQNFPNTKIVHPDPRVRFLTASQEDARGAGRK
jgi:hypothetical protein